MKCETFSVSNLRVRLIRECRSRAANSWHIVACLEAGPLPRIPRGMEYSYIRRLT